MFEKIRKMITGELTTKEKLALANATVEKLMDQNGTLLMRLEYYMELNSAYKVKIHSNSASLMADFVEYLLSVEDEK